MQRLDIGIDAGGTMTRLEARTAAGARMTAADKGSNPRVIGTDTTIAIVSRLILEACGGHLENSNVFLCAGIAGAAARDIQDVIADGLRASLHAAGSTSIIVTDDATTSFKAAFGDGPGSLLLLGTGSNIICRTLSDRWIHSGGWGYLIGDEGSGYAIGRLGLRAVAAAFDRGLDTRLAARAKSDFGLNTRDSFLAKVYGDLFRPADFARIVLEEASQGDIESRLLVSRSIGTLVDDLASTVEPIASDLPRMIRVVGGLSDSALYVRELTAAIAIRLGEEWQIAPSERSPVEGALLIASEIVT